MKESYEELIMMEKYLPVVCASKIRLSVGSEMCQLSAIKNLYEVIKSNAKVVTF